ncbi:ParA family protein [Alcaligenes sp.]|uniref:ParA family protein n=1 Tax=Alcaligenes sp. TaxID=512 RepID=UPI003D08A029
MLAVSLISTKKSVGKTTVAANLDAFVADAGLRVLLLDLDTQPTLSSYYELTHRAQGGIYELLAFNERNLACLVSRTVVNNPDVVLSNDEHHQLNTLMLRAPNGRLRLRNLMPTFQPYYDLVVIDTQDARSVLLEMDLLASQLAVSLVTPEILAARQLRRDTLQLIEKIEPYSKLGIELPVLQLLINRAPAVSSNSRLILQTLRLIFQDQTRIQVLDTELPAIEAFPRAATCGMPVHWVEYRPPFGRVAPVEFGNIRSLANELFPQWLQRFSAVTGRPPLPLDTRRPHGERT